MTERTARARRVRARLVAAAAAVLGLAAPAHAATGDLHVHSGRLPDGTGSVVGPWSGLIVNSAGGTGTFGLAYDVAGQGFDANARLIPPSGLTIASATIDRELAAPVSAYHSQPQIVSTWENRGWPYAGRSSYGGFLGDHDSGTISATGVAQLSMSLRCVDFDGVPGQCGAASYRISRLDLALRDGAPPTVSGSTTGPLTTDPGWQTGATGSLRVTAADVGSGVYRAFIREGAVHVVGARRRRQRPLP
jgi:hypothetical protein